MNPPTAQRLSPFDREPLLAGVEDNPVYRLLTRKHKRRYGTRARRGFISNIFPFTAEEWRDLDLAPIAPRNYTQALWAYTSVSKACSRKWVLICLFAMSMLGVVIWLMTPRTNGPGISPREELISFIFYITSFFTVTRLLFTGYSRSVAIYFIPELGDLIHRFRFVRLLRENRPRFLAELAYAVVYIMFLFVLIIFLVIILGIAIAVLFEYQLLGLAPVVLPALGFCYYLIAAGVARLRTSLAKRRKDAMFEKLTREIDHQMQKRREMDHG